MTTIQTNSTTTQQPTSTCPSWCELTEHEPWYLGGDGCERDHQATLLRDDVDVTVVGVERLVLDFEAIEAGGTIADTSELRAAVPVVQIDMAGMQELGAVELRQLIVALQEGLAIIESDLATADPMDEQNKADRIDGGGCLWEWVEASGTWEHYARELVGHPSVASIAKDASPIGFAGRAS